MKYVKNKIEELSKQCSLCAAKFQIWLDNSRFNDERKDTISQKQLSYCPVCTRADES